jgi:outer membrane lipoprotein-sorting protein
MAQPTARSGARVLPTLILALGAVLAVLADPAPAQNAGSPWDALTELRQGLVKAGPITARFEQTYVPAGFSGGDVEQGHVSLYLPDCLRWNYTEPQEKSFLVCRNEVWAWNEGEEGGRHYQIEAEKEPGLDLLLVDVARLRERYSAEGTQLPNGLFAIVLLAAEPAIVKKGQPNGKAGFFRAKITLDRSVQRVVGLEYSDEDGNLSRFVIREYQSLTHTALFKPPQDIQWTVE